MILSRCLHAAQAISENSAATTTEETSTHPSSWAHSSLPLHKIKLYLVFYPKSLAMKPLTPPTNQVSYGRARKSPNLGWALARILLKLPAKKENIPVTQRVSYLRYVHALVQQQMLRSLDPHLNDV